MTRLWRGGDRVHTLLPCRGPVGGYNPGLALGWRAARYRTLGCAPGPGWDGAFGGGGQPGSEELGSPRAGPAGSVPPTPEAPSPPPAPSPVRERGSFGTAMQRADQARSAHEVGPGPPAPPACPPGLPLRVHRPQPQTLPHAPPAPTPSPRASDGGRWSPRLAAAARAQAGCGTAAQARAPPGPSPRAPDPELGDTARAAPGS